MFEIVMVLGLLILIILILWWVVKNGIFNWFLMVFSVSVDVVGMVFLSIKCL